MTPVQLVQTAHERGITTLTLNSPANRNALSAALVAELTEALSACAEDPAVRAVVLTHTGATFCAGADLKEATGVPPAAEGSAPGPAGSGVGSAAGAAQVASGTGPAGDSAAAGRDGAGASGVGSAAAGAPGSVGPAGWGAGSAAEGQPAGAAHAAAGGTGPAGGFAAVGRDGAGASVGSAAYVLVRLMRAIVELPKPVVARVSGHVRAGGLGLLGACDISVAGPGASFALTEARLGLAPAVISLPLLPRLDPRAAARYYLTAERFDAPEAARIGLITLAADDPDAALAPVLDALRAGSPQGLAETKRLLTAEVLRVFDRDTDDLAALSARLFASDEAREGMTAFLQRRDPVWAR
ncbi:enoyl-CoA hydratase family protein [Streptomyces sp. A3M-1-3]|uniref:enoyl-CoA hydratase family protein n=1 Tax=Streptomyces sp. A3M-1-3 TaxID=2962044 RepID=UPI0035AC0D4A